MHVHAPDTCYLNRRHNVAMDNALPVLGIIAVVGFVVLIMTLHYTRARSILEQWAGENGYEIISREHSFMGGRFWWRKSKDQEVYYVTVRTPEGEVRRGWVRCGGWLLGILSNQADVEWDE
jgi:hypothetical protein